MMRFAIPMMLLLAQPALGADCENLIALSKLSQQTKQDEASVNAHASQFCKSYARHKQDGSAFNAQASFKMLSGSAGGSKSSMEEIAELYCSATNVSEAKQNAYLHYSETIAPGSYEAYGQCIEASKQGLVIDTNPNAVLPGQFSITASFRPSTAAQESTQLAFDASEGVACEWSGGSVESRPNEAVVRRTSTVGLACKRPVPNEEGYLRIIQKDGTASVAIRLPAHDANGHPGATLAQLAADVTALAQTSARNAAPIGTVVFSVATYEQFIAVNGYQESDWVPCDGRRLPVDSPYAKHIASNAPDLRGLFLRGVNDMGQRPEGVSAPDASRKNPEEKAAGEFQADELGRHKHGFSRGAYGGNDPASFPSNPLNNNFGNAQFSHETRKTGGAETRPKNLSGWFYLKIK